jgi:hypothetical protein
VLVTGCVLHFHYLQSFFLSPFQTDSNQHGAGRYAAREVKVAREEGPIREVLARKSGIKK